MTMKVKTGRNAILILGLSMLVVATLACGETPPTATPDTQATVDAAIAATSTAQVSVQATVAAAVEATGVAAQATSTAAPSPASSAEYVTMTEEELAAILQMTVWKLEEQRDFSAGALETLFRELAERFGIKLRELNLPFYVALSGSPVWTPLFGSMEVLGSDMVRMRLRRAIVALGGISSKKLKRLEGQYTALFGRRD